MIGDVFSKDERRQNNSSKSIGRKLSSVLGLYCKKIGTTKGTKLNLIFRKMGNMDPLRGAVLCEVPGKGLGLVATKGLCLYLLSSSMTHSQAGNLSSLSGVRADFEF